MREGRGDSTQSPWREDDAATVRDLASLRSAHAPLAVVRSRCGSLSHMALILGEFFPGTRARNAHHHAPPVQLLAGQPPDRAGLSAPILAATRHRGGALPGCSGAVSGIARGGASAATGTFASPILTVQGPCCSFAPGFRAPGQRALLSWF